MKSHPSVSLVCTAPLIRLRALFAHARARGAFMLARAALFWGCGGGGGGDAGPLQGGAPGVMHAHARARAEL